jgi:hypothetical protein
MVGNFCLAPAILAGFEVILHLASGRFLGIGGLFQEEGDVIGPTWRGPMTS